VVALGVISMAVAASVAGAQEEGEESRTEVSLMGGFQVLNENDTALPDQFINIPAVAAVSYRVLPQLALEGEFTWMIPVEQSVNLESGSNEDLKTPHILAYQANVRGSLPISTYWSPYLAAGVGALTMISNTDEDRQPQVDESETMFALNFGGGVMYDLHERWALRADFRELVAFPADDASGLSDGNQADEIWMERATFGVAYRF